MALLSRFDLDLMRPPVLGGEPDAGLRERLGAWCRGPDNFAMAQTPPHPGLDALACELDGSTRLAQMGPWQGGAWRLWVKLGDLVPALAAADSPWDCGWLRPQGLDRLAHWQPRRNSLLLTTLAPPAPQAWPPKQRRWRVLVVTAQPLPGLPQL